MNNTKIEIIDPRTVWIGEEKAKVNLVMYGDYESEACAKAQDIIDQLLRQSKGYHKVSIPSFPANPDSSACA